MSAPRTNSISHSPSIAACRCVLAGSCSDGAEANTHHRITGVRQHPVRAYARDAAQYVIGDPTALSRLQAEL